MKTPSSKDSDDLEPTWQEPAALAAEREEQPEIEPPSEGTAKKAPKSDEEMPHTAW